MTKIEVQKRLEDIKQRLIRLSVTSGLDSNLYTHLQRAYDGIYDASKLHILTSRQRALRNMKRAEK